ncbi:class I SAM-dependent methyltransferase [Acaryochloris sp. IP29b_bin.137]|uniref:class I SAM-dependent methyltransferase n=1 Tax=Acaryochloris sp. IP29b_bin.137 TaxID=2969217 RepID=UPI00260632B5|nr:class I SAM-dependent methyltransferase [Acaryochloris sp. IP29b_bin.137]
MTVVQDTSPGLATHLINGILAIKPLANFAKRQARSMMIKRAEAIGINWQEEVQYLRSRGGELEFDPTWERDLKQIQKPDLIYPDYYLQPFHAYEQGNLSWDAATEVEVATKAVHAQLWPDACAENTMKLRQNYLNALNAQLSSAPRTILDMGCSVGVTTFTLQTAYPQAQITGLDLSPYFLTVAQYRSQSEVYRLETSHPSPDPIRWVHAAAESTGLPDNSFDLVSAFLLLHELPRTATLDILREARRILRPGGYFAMMDSNPKAEGYVKMPPYVMTLLKSTEPYISDYFSFDIEQAIVNTGFTQPTQTITSPRHHTLITQVQ